MEGVTILGAGGHGRDVAAIAAACGVPVVGFLDDALGGAWSSLDGCYAFGVHDSVTRARCDTKAFPARLLLHPSSYVEPDAYIDAGVVIGPRAVVGPGCALFRHTHVGQMASMVRTTAHRYVTISPGAVICGDVTIEEGASIGAGAVVSNLCEIGAYATIGAGAVLPPRTVVPAHAVWAGVPARPLREAA